MDIIAARALINKVSGMHKVQSAVVAWGLNDIGM